MNNYKRLTIHNIDKILTLRNQHYIVTDIIKRENEYILNIDTHPVMNAPQNKTRVIIDRIKEPTGYRIGVMGIPSYTFTTDYINTLQRIELLIETLLSKLSFWNA